MRYKIIETDEGIILSDLDLHIVAELDDTYIDNFIKNKQIVAANYTISEYRNIPVLQQSTKEIRNMVEDYKIWNLSGKYLNYMGIKNDTSSIRATFIDGYENNPNIYTNEQMTQAIQLARRFDLEEGFDHSPDEIIKMIQPKIECFVEVETIIKEGIKMDDTIEYRITKILQ